MSRFLHNDPELIFLQDQQRVRAVSLDVRADGEKQILRITNYNPDRSLYKPRQRSNSLSVSRQDTMSSSAEAFEAITEEVSSDLTIVIDLAGVGISLINKRMVEVIYLVTDTIKFEYANSAIAQSVNLACGTLQIDNQLHEAIFPVILQPTPIAKESAGVGALPTVQASVIWLKDQGNVLDCHIACYCKKLILTQSTVFFSSNTARSFYKL